MRSGVKQTDNGRVNSPIMSSPTLCTSKRSINVRGVHGSSRRGVDEVWRFTASFSGVDFSSDVDSCNFVVATPSTISTWEELIGSGVARLLKVGGTKTPKASDTRRRRRRVARCGRHRGGGEWGLCFPLPSRLGSLGELTKLPQQGPGRSPYRKRIWCTLELSESHWWQSF